MFRPKGSITEPRKVVRERRLKPGMEVNVNVNDGGGFNGCYLKRRNRNRGSLETADPSNRIWPNRTHTPFEFSPWERERESLLSLSHTHAHARTHTHTYIHIYTHKYTLKYSGTHTHVHIHAHTRTNMVTHAVFLSSSDLENIYTIYYFEILCILWIFYIFCCQIRLG